MPSVSTPSESLAINAVQNSNPKGNQQSDGKKKGKNNKKKGKDGKGNENKTPIMLERVKRIIKGK